jgi:predicted phosphate transport protein (TIGR00153 family)
MPRVKKEDIYYTLLKQLAAVLVDAGEEYVTIMSGYPETFTRLPRMKMLETRADETVREIMTRLYTSFITPFDREDIGELALAMDDVVDHMEAATIRLDLFNVRGMRPEAVELAELTLKAVEEMQEMIDHLPDYKRDEMLMKKAIAVGQVEDGGDEVYENALRALFREDETRGKESLAWLRLFDRMEHVLDACDHAAGVVRNVVLKSA